MSEWVTMETLHIDFADKIAVKRRRNASDNNWRGSQGAPEDDAHALPLDILGARAEAAGKLYMNPVTWNAYSLRHTDADLDDFIDVKGVADSYRRLLISPKKPDHWAYLLVDASAHPEYQIVAWCWGHEGKQQKYWEVKRTDGGGYFIPRNDPIMKPPQELLEELRRRQNTRKGMAGFVGYDEAGRFVAYCQCGAYATQSFSTGTIRSGEFGTWFCSQHLPTRGDSNGSKESGTARATASGDA